MTPLKSLTALWVAIASTFSTNPMSLLRIQRSTSIDFLTTTLPAIGKVLDKSLTFGELQSFSGITKVYKGTKYPVFLREYFELIFHENGLIRPVVDPVILRQLRTLLFMFYKYEMEPSKDQIRLAEQKFRDTDDRVVTSFSECQINAIQPVFHRVFNAIDPECITGRHSSGATEGGYNNLEKRDNFRIIPSLCNFYDLKYFFNCYDHYKWYVQEKGLPKIVEPSSRIAFVPKDSRGPRTICIEPHERMYIQQGLMAELYSFMENTYPFRGRVNFTDQSINADLALASSYTKNYATLDLKDASDLVSWELIKQLLPSNWINALTALRTPTASFPSGETVTLKKFAPMGSALCFPIEALLFFAICRTISDDVYVYGDDIICPTAKAAECITCLESYGLKVNVDKSLYFGDFRESCGTDAFRGSVITPIRYRNDDLVSVVAFANNLSDAFHLDCGEAVIRWYESFNSRIIPRLARTFQSSGAIAFFTDEHTNEFMFAKRYNRDLQIHELRLLSLSPTDRERGKDTYGLLYDYLSIKYRANVGFGSLHYHDPYTRTRMTWSKDDRLTLNKPRLKYCWVRDTSKTSRG